MLLFGQVEIRYYLVEAKLPAAIGTTFPPRRPTSPAPTVGCVLGPLITNMLKSSRSYLIYLLYRVFHGFGQAKFSDGGSILGSSQFSILPQLLLKIMLNSKVFKMD